MEENQAKKNILFGSILKALKKRLKPGHILFLAILLGTNAFAWFIYMEKISSDVNVKVKAWNVSFRLDNQNMTDYINFTVNDMYPGMTPYSETLSVTNDGEVDARLTYEIVSFKVFNDLFTTENGGMTSQQIQTAMRNDYPFQINITTNQEIIGSDGGTASFQITASWPYESTNINGTSNDMADTYWGDMAFTFKDQHPNTPCIVLRVKLSAIQVEPNSQGEPASPEEPGL